MYRARARRILQQARRNGSACRSICGDQDIRIALDSGFKSCGYGHRAPLRPLGFSDDHVRATAIKATPVVWSVQYNPAMSR
jgi:hypothetical protein